MQMYVIRRWFAATVASTLAGTYLMAQTPDPNPVPNPQPPGNNSPVPNPPPNYPDQPRVDARATQPAPIARRAKQVIGARVSLQGNLAIGTVDDIIFSDDGYIDYLVVINEGKYVIVPWQAAKFNFESHSAVLAITQDRFREVPTYTTQTYGTVNFYEPTYVQRIYGYYGIPVPTRHAADRRMDRREDRRDDRRDNRQPH